MSSPFVSQHILDRAMAKSRLSLSSSGGWKDGDEVSSFVATISSSSSCSYWSYSIS